jgi:hypothetical protein
MTKSTPQDDSEMKVIVGSVATLYVTDGTVNLSKGMQGKMLATGMAAAVEGMAGTVASSAMLAMYDGESVQHFGCHIGENMVIGTFENIGFCDDDEVKMIVTKLDEHAYFAHAVIRTSDDLLWMPFASSKGRLGVAMWIATMQLAIGLAGLAFLLFLQIFIKAFHSHWDLILFMGPIIFSVGGIIGFLTYKSSTYDAMYTESILQRIGFKAPWRVDLSPYSEARLGTGGSYQVYDLRKALHAYGSLNEPTPPQSGPAR